MMNKKTVSLLITLVFLSCNGEKLDHQGFRNLQYGALYSDTEKIELTYAKAHKSFKRGRVETSHEKLQRAKKEFNFLITHFDHIPSKKSVVKIDDFYKNHLVFYNGLIEKSKKKNWIFTTAGYYQKVLKLYPDYPDAVRYLSQYKTEINKRLDFNLSKGSEYLKKKQYRKSKRCFTRVLLFDPYSKKSLSSLKIIKRKENQARLLAKKKAENAKKKKRSKKKKRTPKKSQPKKVEPVIVQVAEEEIAEEEIAEEVMPEISAEDKEVLYVKGVNLFEQRDYKSAFETFEAIYDNEYKDVSLYVERSQDKIDALGLDDDKK